MIDRHGNDVTASLGIASLLCSRVARTYARAGAGGKGDGSGHCHHCGPGGVSRTNGGADCAGPSTSLSGAAPATALTLCPGREVGAVVAFGLAADRNSLTDVPILWACQWIADCLDSAGVQAMNGDRVIKSNAEFSIPGLG